MTVPAWHGSRQSDRKSWLITSTGQQLVHHTTTARDAIEERRTRDLGRRTFPSLRHNGSSSPADRLRRLRSPRAPSLVKAQTVRHHQMLQKTSGVSLVTGGQPIELSMKDSMAPVWKVLPVTHKQRRLYQLSLMTATPFSLVSVLLGLAARLPFRADPRCRCNFVLDILLGEIVTSRKEVHLRLLAGQRGGT